MNFTIMLKTDFFWLDVKHRKNRKIDDRKITREQNIFG